MKILFSAIDILCEITLFIDKTHLDVKGKHTLEPVMFTLSIFHRSFRVLPAAWRPLDYLPNMDKLPRTANQMTSFKTTTTAFESSCPSWWNSSGLVESIGLFS